MSDTYRNLPIDNPITKITIKRVPERMRKQSWAVEIMRDNRVTGLRDHKIHRAQVRRKLRLGLGEEVRIGKIKKYGTFYGSYKW